MTIKVLGTGCKKCLTLEAKVKELVQQNYVNLVVKNLKDIR